MHRLLDRFSTHPLLESGCKGLQGFGVWEQGRHWASPRQLNWGRAAKGGALGCPGAALTLPGLEKEWGGGGQQGRGGIVLAPQRHILLPVLCTR